MPHVYYIYPCTAETANAMSSHIVLGYSKKNWLVASNNLKPRTAVGLAEFNVITVCECQ